VGLAVPVGLAGPLKGAAHEAVAAIPAQVAGMAANPAGGTASKEEARFPGRRLRI
jgi:hypothetical protein